MRVEGMKITYQEAKESPCLTCSTTPCCQFLPLKQFAVTTLMELDHALYLLNFDRIALGVSSAGEWAAYYRMPCRFLNQADGLCTVHGTPDQPSICQHYNPYHCWYRRVLTVDAHDDFLVVDRGRMDWLLERIRFDDERRIVDVPEWDGMVEAFARMPLAPDHGNATPANGNGSANGHAEVWQPVSIGQDRAAEASLPAASVDPCSTCSAWCCTRLVVPTGPPTTLAQLDFLRFALGFPGVAVGVGDDSWSLIVETSCRHLDHGRCGLYGAPDRPLLCTYYDALRCTYRVEFEDAPPSGLVLLEREHISGLMELFTFSADGRAEVVPGVDALSGLVRV